MHSVKRLKISELNPHLICVLCGGYYIDATTITECLHTFCKTCIVGYLEASKHCPVCDTLVHKSTPHIRLRPDDTLQDLVYKLVPGLFKDEMKKRRDFYKDEIESGKIDDTPDVEARERIVFSGDELFSLALELSPSGSPPYNPGVKIVQHKIEPSDRRYLQCPAAITIGHLKKFVRMKFNLCDRYQIDLYHTDESLNDKYTLMDVAYIYSWRRKGPLQLYYSVYTNPAKRFKSSPSPTVVVKPATEEKTKAKNSDICKRDPELKTHQENNKVKGRRRKVSKGAESAKIQLQDKPNNSIGNTDSSGTVMNDKGDIKQVVEKEAEKPVLKQVVKEVDSAAIKSELKESDKVDEGEKDEKNDSGIIQDIDTDMDTSDVVQTDGAGGISKEVVEKVETEVETDIAATNVVSEGNEHKETMKEEIASNTQLEKQTENAVEVLNEYKQQTINDCKSVKETKDCETNTPEPSSYSSEIYSSAIDTKRSVKEDIVSEPIVSSTQNTQSCQTESPCSDQMELPQPCENDNAPSTSISDSTCRSTVDASCETDSADLSQKKSKGGISVSTETDVNDFYKDCVARKAVGSSTDVDNHHVPTSTGISVDSSTAAEPTMPGTIDSSSPTSPIPSVTPLSPTKVTVSFSPPCSPRKSISKSPSRSETTGFQSQYHSFVMDLPDTSDEFEGLRNATNLIVPDSLPDTKDIKVTIPVMPQLKSEEIAKKGASTKTGRPRGRPPKVKPAEIKMEGHPVKKPKKHKSRSHSPKQPRRDDKSGKQALRRFSHSVYDSSMLNPKSLTDKQLDNRHRHKSDSQTVSTTEEQRIPKQVLYFSNGQYTITTASGLNRLKQSSPISPTQTVTETPIASYGDKLMKGKTAISNVGQTESKSNSKQSPTEKELKPKKQVSEKAIAKSEVNLEKHSTKGASTSRMSHSITDKVLKLPKNTVATCITKDIHKPVTDDKAKKSRPDDKPHAMDVTKQPEATSSEPKRTAKSPEYRHQSPYFASISGARMPAHRPSTFLNIPVINSSFTPSHLFSQNSYRYGNERLAVPFYRSKSLHGEVESGEKSNGNLRNVEKQSETVSSHSNIVSCQTPFFVPHPAYIYQFGSSPSPSSMSFISPHSSQKSSISPCGYSPDSTKSPVNLKSDSNGINIPANNSKNLKSNSAVRKNKEKSIDNVITAIHEMKSKSEPTYSEQINGIDLSTKSIARQSETKSKLTNNNKDVDKYAFTDDDDSKVNTNLRNYKPDIPIVGHKSAT